MSTITLGALGSEGKELASVSRDNIASATLAGNLALVANFGAGGAAGGAQKAKKAKAKGGEGAGDVSAGQFWFADWKLSGSRLEAHDDRAFGPILFSQYTLTGGVMKSTAQMPPLGVGDSRFVRLEVQRDGNWFGKRGLLERHLWWQAIDNILGDGDVLSERAMLAKLVAGNAEDPAISTKIRVASAASVARATRNCRIHGHAVARPNARHCHANFYNDTGSFMTHHERWPAAPRRTVVAVDIAAANTAGVNRDEHVMRANGWLIQRLELKTAVVGKK